MFKLSPHLLMSLISKCLCLQGKRGQGIIDVWSKCVGYKRQFLVKLPSLQGHLKWILWTFKDQEKTLHIYFEWAINWLWYKYVSAYKNMIFFYTHGTIWHLLRYSFQIKHRFLQLGGELCGLQDPLFGKKLLALWYQEAVRAPALSCWWARI